MSPGLLLLAGLLSTAPPFWGGLEPGPHAVGFRSTWSLDHARRYATSLSDGSTYDGARPILINSWYPARAADAPPMVHGAYLDVTVDGPLEGFSRALAAYARGVVEAQLHGAYEGADDDDRALVAEVLATPTGARRDAPPADGAFPLVVYHSGHGSSFEDNAVLCEWLASHGYVVVGSAFPRGDGESFGIDAKDGSARDVEFLIRAASARAAVDPTRIAMIGHSGGAHAALHCGAVERTALDAIVCLDTTQDYHCLEHPLWKRLVDRCLERADRFRMPLLFAAQPHAIFAFADRLTAAERTYLTVPGMNHDTFIAQGVQHAEAKAARGELPWDDPNEPDAAAIRAGYDALAGVVLAFLDAHLKDDSTRLDAAFARHGRTEPGRGPQLERMDRGDDGPPPFDATRDRRPSARELRPYLRAFGVDATKARLRETQASWPTHPALRHDFIYALAYELHVRGRADELLALDEVLRASFEPLPGVFRALARAYRDRYPDFAETCERIAADLDAARG